MALNNWSFVYGLLVGTSMYAVFKWLYDKSNNKREILNCRDDCFLFEPTVQSINCFKETLEPCKAFTCAMCNFKKYIALIKSTKISLDICVYLITSKNLTDVIINLFKKGVYVRIIIDKQMSDEAYNSKVCVFIKEHIPIKVINTGEMMHNKFVIIDKKKLITGSFNWTRQGLMYNYENGVLIHNEQIIEKFVLYFENMWLSPSRDLKVVKQ